MFLAEGSIYKGLETKKEYDIRGKKATEPQGKTGREAGNL